MYNLFDNKINKFLFYCFIVLFTFFIITAIIVQRAMYADGVHFLLNIMNQTLGYGWPMFNHELHIRLFIDFLNQLLPSLAVFFKIESFQAVNYLFNTNLFLMPVIMSLVVFYISKSINKIYLSYVVFVCFTYFVFGSYIFILNQAITFSFILWAILIYTFMDRQPKLLDWMLISLLLMLTFRGHEMILTVAPVIFLASIWKINENYGLLKYFKLYIALVITLAFLFAIYWQLSHPVTTQTSGFISIILKLFKLNIIFDSILSIPLVAVIISFILLTLYYFKKNNKLTTSILIWIYLIFTIYIIINKTFFNLPDVHVEFDYRIFISFGLPVLMLMMVIYIKLRLDFITKELATYLIRLSLIAIIFMSIWQIEHNFHWNSFLTKINKNIEASTLIEIDKDDFIIPLDEASKRYSWIWCWSNYSVLVQNGKVSKIILPPKEYEKYYDISREDKKIQIPFCLFSKNQYIDFTKLTTAKMLEVESKFRIYNWRNFDIKDIKGISLSHKNDIGWTKDNNASLKIDLLTMPTDDITIKIKGWAFVNSKHKEQKVNIHVNKIKVFSKVFKLENNDHLEHSFEFVLEKRFILSTELNIQFVFENLVSPHELGISSDNRKLGLAIREIDVSIK